MILPGKAPAIIGVAPRSIYSAREEANAWLRAQDAARGNIRPVTVRYGRKLLGVVQGLDPRSPLVRSVRLHPNTPYSKIQKLLEDMRETRREISEHPKWDLMPFNDENAINASISGGKFGRTQWGKTHTGSIVANNWYDLWPVGGNPGLGTVNGTARTAITPTDATTGAIYHRGNVSTDTKHIMSMIAISTGNTPLLMLYDRVVAYDQCTFSTSNQAMTNTLTAARYASGAPGLLPCLVTGATVLSATAANLTQFQYTDDAGNATQSMPTSTTVSLIVSAAAPTATIGARVFAPSTSAKTFTWGYHLPLANGDNGCRLVANYTWSAANTGSFTCVLIHPICELIMPTSTVPSEIDYIHQMAEIEQIIDGACLNFFEWCPVNTGHTLNGTIRYAWHS